MGSDLDVIVVIADTNMPLMDRRRRYEPNGIPVPADLLVYTESEWAALKRTSPRTHDTWTAERIELTA